MFVALKTDRSAAESPAPITIITYYNKPYKKVVPVR